MKIKRPIRLILIVIYFGILAIITLGRHGYHTTNVILYWDYIKRNIQLVPTKMIFEFLQLVFNSSTNDTVRMLSALNLVGNIAMFIPFGLFWGRKRLGNFVIWAIVFTAVIEVIQLFTLKGSFDIDDILLNVFGAIIGYILYNKIGKYIFGTKD